MGIRICDPLPVREVGYYRDYFRAVAPALCGDSCGKTDA